MRSKKDFICSVPFTDLEIMEGSNHLCCHSWLPTSIPTSNTLLESWNSEIANSIRDSILDGSYRYCDETQCPALSHIRQENSVDSINSFIPIYSKDNLPSKIKNKLIDYQNKQLYPTTIHFSFDQTCNLKCPSCRVGLITSSSSQIKYIEAKIEDINKNFGSHIEILYITGSGDPFASPSFRKFLKDFDKSKYPVLKKIHLHTNATMWTPKMWESMKNIHPYVKSCEISIDAGTKDTYENKTRIGGNWDRLIENLKFISTLETIKNIKTSFVVQESNYMEMNAFYSLITDIFRDKANIFFSKVTNWGAYTDKEYKKQKIWDSSHPNYYEFLDILSTVIFRKNVSSNMHDLVTDKPRII